MTILHSPAEPASMVRALTRVATSRGHQIESSSLAEPRGVDFLWRAQRRWWGVQRKELHDFLASLEDGRLAKEVDQMRAHITMPVLILEGAVRVAGDAVITNGFGRPLMLSALHKRLFSLQSRDIAVFQAADMSRTAEMVVDLHEWSLAEGHATATGRPKPAGDWGKPSNRDFQIHLLTGLPGVGRGTASAILDALGRCPLVLDATEGELVTVPGVGATTARRMLAAVNWTRGDKRMPARTAKKKVQR